MAISSPVTVNALEKVLKANKFDSYNATFTKLQLQNMCQVTGIPECWSEQDFHDYKRAVTDKVSRIRDRWLHNGKYLGLKGGVYLVYPQRDNIKAVITYQNRGSNAIGRAKTLNDNTATRYMRNQAVRTKVLDQVMHDIGTVG